MFCGCKNLSDLDISSFNLTKATNFNILYMHIFGNILFVNCLNLRNIKVSKIDFENQYFIRELFELKYAKIIVKNYENNIDHIFLVKENLSNYRLINKEDDI